MHVNAKPTDYVFMPEYTNRTTATNTYRRIFNHFLQETGLKKDKDGNDRSPYSLRHYALQTRLVKSDGKVNIYWLAENAGTSVDQLERFYLKNLGAKRCEGQEYSELWGCVKIVWKNRIFFIKLGKVSV